MAFLRLAFKGESQREPLILQLAKKKASITEHTLIQVRKSTSEDGQRHFYSLDLVKEIEELDGKNFFMFHRRHRTHINTLCGSLILRTLIDDSLDRDLLVSELLDCQNRLLESTNFQQATTRWQLTNEKIQLSLRPDYKQSTFAEQIDVAGPHQKFIEKLQIQTVDFDQNSFLSKSDLVNSVVQDILACGFESEDAKMFRRQGLLNQFKLN